MILLSKTLSKDHEAFELSDSAPRWQDRITTFGYGRLKCKSILYQGEPNARMALYKDSYDWGLFKYVICGGDSGGPHFNTNGQITAISSASHLLSDLNTEVAGLKDDLLGVIDYWRESEK